VNEVVTAYIVAVRDYGPLVILYLTTDEGRILPVPLDRDSFSGLLAQEHCGPDELVGRRISYEQNRICFLDHRPD
jgi:hypothetical protein